MKSLETREPKFTPKEEGQGNSPTILDRCLTAAGLPASAAPQAEENEGEAFMGAGVCLVSEPIWPPPLDADGDPDPAATEGWAIRSLEDLEWALKRLGELEVEAEGNRRRAQAEADSLQRKIAVIRERRDAINAPLERGVVFFESHIKAYAEKHKGELLGSGKRKTRKFLHGALSWKKTGGRWRYRQDPDGERLPDAEKQLLAWAQSNHPGAIREKVERSVDLDAVKTYAKTTGEVPDGLEFVPESDELEIKAK